MPDQFLIQIYDTLTHKTYHLAVTAQTQFKAIGELIQSRNNQPTNTFSFHYNNQRMHSGWKLSDANVQPQDRIDIVYRSGSLSTPDSPISTADNPPDDSLDVEYSYGKPNVTVQSSFIKNDAYLRTSLTDDNQTHQQEEPSIPSQNDRRSIRRRSRSRGLASSQSDSGTDNTRPKKKGRRTKRRRTRRQSSDLQIADSENEEDETQEAQQLIDGTLNIDPNAAKAARDELLAWLAESPARAAVISATPTLVDASRRLSDTLQVSIRGDTPAAATSLLSTARLLELLTELAKANVTIPSAADVVSAADALQQKRQSSTEALADAWDQATVAAYLFLSRAQRSNIALSSPALDSQLKPPRMPLSSNATALASPLTSPPATHSKRRLSSRRRSASKSPSPAKTNTGSPEPLSSPQSQRRSRRSLSRSRRERQEEEERQREEERLREEGEGEGESEGETEGEGESEGEVEGEQAGEMDDEGEGEGEAEELPVSPPPLNGSSRRRRHRSRRRSRVRSATPTGEADDAKPKDDRQTAPKRSRRSRRQSAEREQPAAPPEATDEQPSAADDAQKGEHRRGHRSRDRASAEAKEQVRVERKQRLRERRERKKEQRAVQQREAEEAEKKTVKETPTKEDTNSRMPLHPLPFEIASHPATPDMSPYVAPTSSLSDDADADNAASSSSASPAVAQDVPEDPGKLSLEIRQTQAKLRHAQERKMRLAAEVSSLKKEETRLKTLYDEFKLELDTLRVAADTLAHEEAKALAEEQRARADYESLQRAVETLRQQEKHAPEFGLSPALLARRRRMASSKPLGVSAATADVTKQDLEMLHEDTATLQKRLATVAGSVKDLEGTVKETETKLLQEKNKQREAEYTLWQLKTEEAQAANALSTAQAETSALQRTIEKEGSQLKAEMEERRKLSQSLLHLTASLEQAKKEYQRQQDALDEARASKQKAEEDLAKEEQLLFEANAEEQNLRNVIMLISERNVHRISQVNSMEKLIQSITQSSVTRTPVASPLNVTVPPSVGVVVGSGELGGTPKHTPTSSPQTGTPSSKALRGTPRGPSPARKIRSSNTMQASPAVVPQPAAASSRHTPEAANPSGPFPRALASPRPSTLNSPPSTSHNRRIPENPYTISPKSAQSSNHIVTSTSNSPLTYTEPARSQSKPPRSK